MHVGRGAFSALLVALISSLLFARPAAANTVAYALCDNTGAHHCYAVITQGIGLDGSHTLSSLSSGSATLSTSCALAYSTTSGFVTTELWLVTPPNPSGPAYLSPSWRSEWIEYGITNGVINGTYYALKFFWARNYWSPTYASYLYNEYVASGTPNVTSSYAVEIRWLSAGYWQILRGGTSQYTGIRSQQPPGAHQAVQAGAEMTIRLDEEDGKVSNLANVQNGTSHTNWTGYVFVDPDIFLIDQSADHLTFRTVRTCP